MHHEKRPAIKQKNPAYIIKKSPTNMVPGVSCIMKRALHASKRALHISGKDPSTYDARSLLHYEKSLVCFKRALHTSGKKPTYMIPGAFCFMQRALHECSATCHTPRMTPCRYYTIEKPYMHYCTTPTNMMHKALCIMKRALYASKERDMTHTPRTTPGRYGIVRQPCVYHEKSPVYIM